MSPKSKKMMGQNTTTQKKQNKQQDVEKRQTKRQQHTPDRSSHTLHPHLSFFFFLFITSNSGFVYFDCMASEAKLLYLTAHWHDK